MSRWRVWSGVGGLLLLMTGCVTTLGTNSLRSPEQQVAQVPTSEAVLDFGGLYGGVSTQSLWDESVIEPGLMDRLLIEPGVLEVEEADGPIEVWTRGSLLQWLIMNNVLVIGAPLPAAADPTSPCPEGGCRDPSPTAALRALRLVSVTDSFGVVVEEMSPSGVHIRIRRHPGEKSVCSEELRMELGFVQFNGYVQRMADGALAGQFRELEFLSGPKDSRISIDLPDRAMEPDAFCAGVEQAYVHSPKLLPSDERFEAAIARVLERGLRPFMQAEGEADGQE